MFGIWERKQLIKINMLHPERPDACFVINKKIKKSIIAKYARGNELYATRMIWFCEDHSYIEYEGEMYRLWDDVHEWTKRRNEFKRIDDEFKGASLEEAANIVINSLTGKED